VRLFPPVSFSRVYFLAKKSYLLPMPLCSPIRPPHVLTLPILLLAASLLLPVAAQAQQQQQATTADRDLSDRPEPTLLEQVQEPFETLDFSQVQTGVLYDRAHLFSEAGQHTGQPGEAAIGYGTWKQLYAEMALGEVSSPGPLSSLDDVTEEAMNRAVQDKVVPIVVMDLQYDRIKETAVEDGLIERRQDGQLYDVSGSSETPYETDTAFAATPVGEVVRDRSVTFALDGDLYSGNSSRGTPDYFEVDLGDGSGFQQVSFGGQVTAAYTSDGEKTGRLRAHYADGSTRESAFTFEVQSMDDPACDQTWGVSLPFFDVPIQVPPDELDGHFTISRGTYEGEPASFNACALYGDGHSSMQRPLIFVEGFDIYGTFDLQRLYEDYGDLAEGLRDMGFDVIILNFQDAKTYIQRNSEALITLIEDVNELKNGREPNVVTGASMGGIVARYALAKMETNGRKHETDTYVSFDSPHRRANIPLGLQYWGVFHQAAPLDYDEPANDFVHRINSPAAKQLLAYPLHYLE